MVICADPGEGEEENLALPAAVITTLYKSSKFKKLFDQLGLTAKKQKIATEALVSIAFRAGIKCLSVEVVDDRASYRSRVKSLLVMRPLYLAASINQIPIKRALVDIGASVNLIPLSTL